MDGTGIGRLRSRRGAALIVAGSARRELVRLAVPDDLVADVYGRAPDPHEWVRKVL